MGAAGNAAMVLIAVIAAAAGFGGYEFLLVHPKTPAEVDKQSNRVLTAVSVAFVAIALLVLGFMLYAGVQ